MDGFVDFSIVWGEVFWKKASSWGYWLSVVSM
jgi:hypothetical protein